MLIKRPLSYGTADLSICIPAYMRVEELEQCLRSLIEQVNTANAEIIIMLNGASLDVERLAHEWSDANAKVGIYKKEKNIAEEIFLVPFYDLDCRSTVVFSDDDIALPGFIDRLIVELIHSDLVISNYKRVDKTCKRITDHSYLSDVKFTKFIDPNELLSTFGHRIQFISCVAINLKHFKSSKEPDKHILDIYGHSYSCYIYKSIAKLKKINVTFIQEPIILQRSYVADFSHPELGKVFYKIFILGPAMVTKNLRSYGYSTYSLISYARIHIKYLMFEHTFNCLAQDTLERMEIFRAITRYHILNLTFYFRILPLFIMPNSILRLLKRVNKAA